MTRVRQPDVDAGGLMSRGGLRARYGGYSTLGRWYRRLRPRWAWERANPLGKATRRYVQECGLVVRRGPFSGLAYPGSAVGTVTYLPAKLLGCYERELQPILAGAIDFDVFVDIGAGDGYYCVGFKRLFPRTRVIGYETDRAHRRMAAKLAEFNGVRVEMCGEADHSVLNALPDGRLLLLADVEGYEYDLLDPDAVPSLRDVTMIVETHPSIHPDIREVLTSRFWASHQITKAPGAARQVADFEELAQWEEPDAHYAITEGRDADPLWLVLRPRPRGH